MAWFKDFYESDYFKYYDEPRLHDVPAQEVAFILAQGGLDLCSPRRARVFDICCGTGRHARPLAAKGCEVIGVDLSAVSIQAARQQAQAQGLGERCRFHQGDIRDFDPPGECDLAINIFTSFGYFDSDQEDAVILAKAAQSLRPGGRFILDVANREAVIAGLHPRHRQGPRGNYVIEDSHLDLSAGRLISHWTFVRGKHRAEHTISIRLYALHELIALVSAAGLRYLAAFGAFDGEPYSPRTPRCILVAEKDRTKER